MIKLSVKSSTIAGKDTLRASKIFKILLRLTLIEEALTTRRDEALVERDALRATVVVMLMKVVGVCEGRKRRCKENIIFLYVGVRGWMRGK